MSHSSLSRALGSIALVFALAAPASATDGHFLHGVGAINSAMGGAGVAAPGDLMGSMYLNPAGLTTIEGVRFTLGFELFKPDRTLSSTVPMPDGSSFSGSTLSESAFTPIPNFGFSVQVSEKVTLGLAGLGVGGFGVDYPQNNLNPIQAPRPQGFGQIFSSFQLMKFVVPVAWKPSEQISLGAAFNMDWAQLAVDPFPAASPAISNPTEPDPFYSRATAADGAFGYGFQLGLIWHVVPTFNVGLAYTSKQSFEDFEFNSKWENPNILGQAGQQPPDQAFGTDRTMAFKMDVPAVYAGGVTWMPDRWMLSADARYITYSSTAGFDKSGFDQTGAVQGFGWDDIWVFAGGLQFQPTPSWALRGGYNYTDNPIPDAQSFFNAPAPAIVQNHLTLGIGWQARGLAIDAGYYRAFGNEITGPVWGLGGPIPSSSVTTELSEDSFLLQFSFSPGSSD